MKSYWNGSIKWVSLADSDKLDQIYIYDTDKKISELGISNSSAVKHSAGTVILSRDAGIGRSAVLAHEMAVSQHFMAWKCGERLHNMYLYFWLQSQKPLFEKVSIGSTIQTIGLAFFRKLTIALPSITEQTLVSRRLLAAESALATHVTHAEKLRFLHRGLGGDLLSGRIRVTPLLNATTS